MEGWRVGWEEAERCQLVYSFACFRVIADHSGAILTHFDIILAQFSFVLTSFGLYFGPRRVLGASWGSLGVLERPGWAPGRPLGCP